MCLYNAIHYYTIYIYYYILYYIYTYYYIYIIMLYIYIILFYIYILLYLFLYYVYLYYIYIFTLYIVLLLLFIIIISHTHIYIHTYVRGTQTMLGFTMLRLEKPSVEGPRIPCPQRLFGSRWRVNSLGNWTIGGIDLGTDLCLDTTVKVCKSDGKSDDSLISELWKKGHFRNRFIGGTY
jgi:hypothetical protein